MFYLFISCISIMSLMSFLSISLLFHFILIFLFCLLSIFLFFLPSGSWFPRLPWAGITLGSHSCPSYSLSPGICILKCSRIVLCAALLGSFDFFFFSSDFSSFSESIEFLRMCQRLPNIYSRPLVMWPFCIQSYISY